MTAYSKQSIPESWRAARDAHPVEMDIIASVDSIGGYEWDELMVLRHPDTGQLYTVEGSGCSCNSLLDEVYGVSDLDGPYTWREVASKAQAWEREGYSDRRRGLGAQVVEALMRMEAEG